MSHTDGRLEPPRLRLIGGFRLLAADGLAVTITSRRARALIGYLRLAPDQSATRERLAGLLWSERGEAQARASLRQCVLELRGVFLDAELDILEVGRETIGLRRGALGADVADLQEALREQDWNRLLAVLRAMGDARLMDDLEIGGLHQDWLLQTRARLDEAITGGVHACLKQREALRDWGMVRAMAEAYLHRDPLDEMVVAAAIRTDVAIGAKSVAHRRFQVLQAALAKEFGVAPGAAALDALSGRGAETPVAEISATVLADGPPLVIVAGFEVNAAGGGDSAMAGILREEVVSGLSRFRDLRVITDPRPLDMIGAELPDAYVLGASLRALGPDARLTAQLLRVGDRQVIWSDRLTVTRSEVVGAIDDIIAKVVGAVLPTIHADLLRRASGLPMDATYQRYLVARDAAARAETYAEAVAAAEALEALVATNPNFALPYLPLAFLYNTDFHYTRAGRSGPKERERALDLAKTALALDRGHAHGYTVTGWCYLRRQQWEPAKSHFEQAIQLNSFDAKRVMEVGFGQLFLGDLDQARTLLDRCLLLNPAPDDEFFKDLGLLELVRGDYDRADGYLELIADPSLWSRLYIAINAQMSGRPAETKIESARNHIASIWPASVPMDADALSAWIAGHHPFRDAQMHSRFLAAARRTLNGS
jgi:DNA-binding SARP family transcriptional activator/tetratricopeptide (TPR) repeat protein